jgi:hypothetical protein
MRDRDARRSLIVVKRLLVSALISVALGNLLAIPAGAQTTVSVSGKVVKITVKVDVFGAEGQVGSDGTPLIDYWQKVLRDSWGERFKQLPYKSCLVFELDLKLVARDPDAKERAGRHRLHVTAERPGNDWEGVGWGGVTETSRNRVSGDGTRSFENDRVGTIPVNAPPLVVAHEFGHLFGLGDDRNKDGTPKPNRGPTVMVGGAHGNDPNGPIVIDQALIDRIAKQIANAIDLGLANNGERLPTCETWSGTIRSESSGAQCTGEESGTIELAVIDGKVTGTATASGSYTCAGVTIATSGGGAFTGTFELGEFKLNSDPGTFGGNAPVTWGCLVGRAAGQGFVTLAVDGGRGSANPTYTAPSGDVYTCSIAIARDDENEPVG